MHATTAKKLAQDATTYQAIKEPLHHTLVLIGQAAAQGEMTLVLPRDYTLRSTSIPEFESICKLLTKDGYKVAMQERHPELFTDSETHPLDQYTITISWE